MKFRLTAIFLTLFILASLAAPVFAHASLVKSNPEANVVLPRPPVLVEIFFSEPLEPTFSSITILNTDGKTVDSNDSRVDATDPTRLTVSVRSIPDGVYTVSWKALSAVDGHVTTGSFPFAVGNADPAALAAADQASRRIRFSFDETVARWLLFLSATALTGGTLFKLFVWRNTLNVKAFNTLTISALIIFNLANILSMMSQAGQAGNTGFAFPWEISFTGLLANTRYGSLWLGRFALSLLLAYLALQKNANIKKTNLFTFIVSAFILLSISLGSHAASDAEPTLPIINDWLHLFAASVWVGGLFHFALGLWTLRQEINSASKIAQLIPRFSALALISVGVLTLTGLYASVLRIGTLTALNDTIYGRTLIVKLIIALPMIGLGALNLFVITPAMKKDENADLVQNFRRIVSSEVAMGVVLLLSVGVLTSLPPAQTASTLPALTGQASVDELNLAIEISPGRIGQNTFTVKVTTKGVPVTDAQEVRLQFTSQAGKVPPSRVQLAHQGNGVYSTKGTFLSLPDAWQVQAVVRRENKFDAYANFDFNVGTVAPTFAWGQLNAFLLLATGVTYFLALGRRHTNTIQRISTGVVPALVLLALGVYIYYYPPLATRNLLANPIPPNATSVATGKDLFEKNCVVCHGTTGKGDGPVGLTLTPRPADLSLHAVPGVHPDGQIYEWISNGFANTPMPTYRDKLSDEQRWHLVNYIRTLAPK